MGLLRGSSRRLLALVLALLPATGFAANDLIYTSGYEDGEVCSNGCPPDGWKSLQWGQAVASASCQPLQIYGIVPGDAFLFTTCVPPGQTPGSGDPRIASVTDNLGNDYQASNDDCSEAQSLPQLFGWNCNNNVGAPTMACAPQDRNGLIVQPGASRLTVTICPFDGNGAGTAPLYLWWRGSSTPNPG